MSGPTDVAPNATPTPIAADTAPASSSWVAPQWIKWVGGIVLFAGAVVVPLARQQGVHPWQVLWAEDGVVYYPDALHHGINSLFRGSDGYVQFVSRMLMVPTALMPIAAVAKYVTFAAAVFSAAVAAFVYRSTRGWLASVPIRLLVSGFYVLGPAAAWEQTGNFTNAIWILLPAVPWALVSKRRGPVDVAVRGLVVLLAALSHPLAALFFPLAAAVVWRRRTTESWAVGGALALGVAAQAAFMLVAPDRHPRATEPLFGTFPAVSVDVLGSFLIGERYLSDLWVRYGFVCAIVFLAVTLLVVVVCAWGASSTSRMLGLVLVAYAALMACGPLLLNGSLVLQEGVPLLPIQRYVFAPVALLVGAIAVLVDSPDRSRRRLVARIGRPVLIVQSLIVILISFAVWNPRSHGPLWHDSVQTARTACAGGDGIAYFDLTPPGWIVILECKDVRD